MTTAHYHLDSDLGTGGIARLVLIFLAITWALHVMFDGPWTIATTISLLVLVVIVGVNIGWPITRRSRRRRSLEKPFHAHFVVEYGGDDHWVRELVVPANSEIDVQLRLHSRVFYEEDSFIFGFDGSLDDVPYPRGIFNRFVKEGLIKEESPAESRDQFLTKKLKYHVKRKTSQNPSRVRALGFRVTTRTPGMYSAYLMSVNEVTGGVPREPLAIKVEDAPQTEMRCLIKSHGDCRIPASASLRPGDVGEDVTGGA